MASADEQRAARAKRQTRQRVVLTIAIVLTIIAAVLLWRYNLRDNLTPRNFGVVDEGKLYRAAALTPAMLEKVVRERHIRTIVDLGAWEPGSAGERVERQTAEALGVGRVGFHLNGDGTGDAREYVAALEIILDPAKQPVLVHCATGTQRTGACVMMYRALTKGGTWEAWFDEARSYGHDPKRNPKLGPYMQQEAAGIVAKVREDERQRGETAVK